MYRSERHFGLSEPPDTQPSYLIRAEELDGEDYEEDAAISARVVELLFQAAIWLFVFIALAGVWVLYFDQGRGVGK